MVVDRAIGLDDFVQAQVGDDLRWVVVGIGQWRMISCRVVMMHRCERGTVDE